MSDEHMLRELENLKREVAQLKAQGSGRRAFSKKWAWIGISLLLIIATFTVYADTISKPHTFTAGTAISASEVNSNFDALYTESNAQHTRISTLETNSVGKLTLRYLICTEGIYPTRPGIGPIASGVGGADPGIGEIGIFAGNFEPMGWMYCDGRILQIMQYQALYSILGTTYGGDGRNNFALPDLRGKVPVHPN